MCIASSAVGSHTILAFQHLARRLSDEYALGGKLGTGSYAVVKECTNKGTGEHFAVKIIEKKHAKEARLKSEVDYH